MVTADRHGRQGEEKVSVRLLALCSCRPVVVWCGLCVRVGVGARACMHAAVEGEGHLNVHVPVRLSQTQTRSQGGGS